MKAEISNLSPTGVRSWSGVYLQQGRMLVDRDWNELCGILTRLVADAADEAIGTGTPRHEGLIRSDGNALFVRPGGGLVAAGGLLARPGSREVPAEKPLYIRQVDLPETVRRPTAGLNPDGIQPLVEDVPEDGYLYVDVWERVVTAFEVGDLIDVALNGADTAFRTQRMAQIKLAGTDDVDKDGDPCLPRFFDKRIPQTGTARLLVEPADEIETSDDCDPCVDQVTLQSALQNHLFRLEVHDVTYQNRQPVRLVLKWSNDNGARELRFDETDRQRADRAYEYFSDASEMLLGMPSDDWPADSRDWRGQLDPADPDKLADVMPRVREWDGWAAFQRGGGGVWSLVAGHSYGVTLTQTPAPTPGLATVSANASTIVIRTTDKLMTFDVDDAQFLAGDAWLALSRARAAEGERIRMLSQTPVGVRHHYCLLGQIGGTDDIETIIKPDTPHDLRRLNHPALTCLDADDVGYETSCPSGLFTGAHNTVKKALDRVCSIDAGHVGYQSTCPSGLFTNAHNTVEKALDRVCSINATHVAFDPGCDLLAEANATTVAQAIDVLCDNLGQSPAEDLPRIVKVNWRNDLTMLIDDFFNNGLIVSFNEDMRPECATSDNFIVMLEVPSRELLSDNLLLLHPVIVPGKIDANGNEWRFLPDQQKLPSGQLKELLSTTIGIDPTLSGYRCRVTLTSASILGNKGDRHLDGEVLKVPATRADGNFFLDLQGAENGELVTGNGARGGDFESWFYLNNQQLVDDPVITTAGNRMNLVLINNGVIAQRFNTGQQAAFTELVDLSVGLPDLRPETGNVQPPIVLNPQRRASRPRALAAFNRMDAEGTFSMVSTEPLASAAKIIAERVSAITNGQVRFNSVPAPESRILATVAETRASLLLIDDATFRRLGRASAATGRTILQF